MESRRMFWGYLKRFTLSHVISYLVCGLIFMVLMNYGFQFAQDPAFAGFRPLTSPIVRAAVLFQFIRGALFALILAPFRKTIVESRWGWLMLFGVIFGMTCIGAVNASPGSIEGFIYTELSLSAHLVGMPEVITQSLLFSLAFWIWERRLMAKSINSQGLHTGSPKPPVIL